MGNGLRNLRQMGLDVMEKCVAIVSKESKGMHFNRVTTLEAGALSWTPQQLFRSVITTPLILTDANSLLVLCYNLCCRVYRLHLDVVWTSAKYYMSLRWKVDIMKNAQVFVGEPDGKTGRCISEQISWEQVQLKKDDRKHWYHSVLGDMPLWITCIACEHSRQCKLWMKLIIEATTNSFLRRITGSMPKLHAIVATALKAFL